MTKKIGIFVGSLRKDSFNKLVAKTMADLFPAGFEPVFINIGDLELYNQDLDDEGTPTEAWTTFREEVKQVDGVMFVTPEYNRSLAPVLKNAIDIASRGKEGNLWKGKPAAVFSSTIGSMGGVSSNLALKQSFTCVGLIAMAQPEIYLARINNLIDKDGKLIPDTRDFIQNACDSFVDFAGKIIG